MPKLRQKNVERMHRKFADNAELWDDAEQAVSLRQYCFRHGVAHMLHAGEVRRAESLLTDFSYLQTRTKELPGAECRKLAVEYSPVLNRLEAGSARDRFTMWESFFREVGHILGRASDYWPANRILLQIATEHADDSPVTEAAEKWLAEGHCNWLWLRSAKRPESTRANSFLRVMEGHKKTLNGVKQLPLDRLLSWSGDGTLRLWSLSGKCLDILEGHSGSVNGMQMLPNDRIVSWSEDKTIRIWDINSWECVSIMEGHTAGISGIMQLDENRIVSWGGPPHPKLPCSEHIPRIWNLRTGECLAKLEGQTAHVTGILQLNHSRLLSWSHEDNTIIIWNAENGNLITKLNGHTEGIEGVLKLSDGRVLSWTEMNALRIWNPENGECMLTLGDDYGHWAEVNGALQLSNGILISYDNTLRIWNVQNGECLKNFGEEPNGLITGALELSDGRLLSWFKTLYIWDLESGECSVKLEGHWAEVNGALELSNGRLITWSHDNTLRIWNTQNGECLNILEGHTDAVLFAQQVAGDLLLSGSRDGTLRLWNPESQGDLATNDEHKANVISVQKLSDEQLLSYDENGKILIWNAESGKYSAILEDHGGGLGGRGGRLEGLRLLPKNKLLSWERQTLCLWNLKTFKCEAKLDLKAISNFCAFQLPNGKILNANTDGLILWNPQTGNFDILGERAKLRNLENKCYDDSIGENTIIRLPNGHLLSWHGESHSNKKTALIWGPDGVCVSTILDDAHSFLALKNDRLLTLSKGDFSSQGASAGTVRIWNIESATCQYTLKGNIAVQLTDGRILIVERIVDNDQTDSNAGGGGGHTGTIGIWDIERGKWCAKLDLPGKRQKYNTITGQIQQLTDNRFLFEDQGTIYIWNIDNQSLVKIQHESVKNWQKIILLDGRLLTWSGTNLWIWETNQGKCLTSLKGHSNEIKGALELEDGNLLSWSNKTLRLWNEDGLALGCWCFSLAPFEIPQIWLRYLAEVPLQHRMESLHGFQSTGGLVDGTGVARDAGEIILTHRSLQTAVWHADGNWNAEVLLKSGTVAASMTNKVKLLHLYHGNHKLDLMKTSIES